MAIGLHLAQFYEYRKIAVISKKEEDAFDLVDRMKFIYTHQGMWVRNLCRLAMPMKAQRIGHLFFENGSQCFGLSQGPDQIRQHTASLILADEAAFQEEFEGIYGACQPSLFGGGKFVAFSSANAGYFQRAVEC
jgi:phage FluMu gp28-like protein